MNQKNSINTLDNLTEEWDGRNVERVRQLIGAMVEGDLAPHTRRELDQWFASPLNEDEKNRVIADLLYREIVDSGSAEVIPDEELRRRFAELSSKLGLPVKQFVAEPPKRRPLIRRIAVKAAAAVLIPILVMTGAYLLINRPDDGMTLRIASTDYAQSVFLPDNSSASVQPGSTILYRESPDVREAELSGEAFFKVSRDTLKPFRVSTLNMKVDVLGTEFSVTEFPGDSLGVVSLFNGSVSVETGGVTRTLSRGERLTHNFITHEVDISIIPSSEMIVGGYKPRLKFDNAPLGEILGALEAVYEIKIETAGDIDTAQGLHSINLEHETLEGALRLLVIINKDKIAYKIEEDKVTITRN